MRIFLSYGRDDKDRVLKCKRDLESDGHSVWMDGALKPGDDWERVLDAEIEKSERALVFLSKKTTQNFRYQQREIQKLIELGKARRDGFIVPVRLDKCPVPQGLQHLHALNHFERNVWRSWRAHFLHAPKSNVQRLLSVPVAGRALPLPTFFPSLSTAAKTTISVPEHIELLLSVSAPQFLVSAADIYKLRSEKQKGSRRISELVTKASDNGQIVLMDSGNYERFWQKLRSWSRKNFHEVLSYVPVQLAFCYDDLNPPATVSEIVAEIEKGALRDQKASDMEAMLPIVHCPRPQMFPEVCAQVLNRLRPLMIGVPERELGGTLVERIDCVAAIRAAMNATGQYCPLHLLGTGNPRSLGVLSLAGADSFDGLEWCQTCVDYDTHTLHHLSHVDLYWHQSPVGSSVDISPAARALTHNLLYYEEFMARLRAGIQDGSIVELVRKVVGEDRFARLFSLSEGLRQSVRQMESR